MHKTILITGSTDGIGLEAAKSLADDGHEVLLHGRNADKLDDALQQIGGNADQGYLADLSNLDDVVTLAESIQNAHAPLDVLINNAGVFRVNEPNTSYGVDVRFVVNTIAPYLLTKNLLQILSPDGRVVNLSSAAQAPVSLDALNGEQRLSESGAYAQSKLALTMWSRHLAMSPEWRGRVVVSVNPGSMLATKMVKEAYGVHGADIGIGSDILHRAAVSDAFAKATGLYFDNDSGRFADPYPDALNDQRCAALAGHLDQWLQRVGHEV